MPLGLGLAGQVVCKIVSVCGGIGVSSGGRQLGAVAEVVIGVGVLLKQRCSVPQGFAGQTAQVIVNIGGAFAVFLCLGGHVAIQIIRVGVSGLGGAVRSGIGDLLQRVDLIVGVSAHHTVWIGDAAAGAVGVVGIPGGVAVLVGDADHTPHGVIGVVRARSW